MIGKVSFLLMIAAVAARPSSQDLDSYTFEQFVKEFNVKFDASELESRRELFTTELTRVREHNAKGLSWKEGINKFSAMTKAEKKKYHGHSKNHAREERKGGVLKHAKELPEDFVIKPVSALPTAVDWRDTGIVSAVKDQGHCGSCWAFSSTEVIESHVAKASGLLFDLSVEQMAMCTPNPDSCGGTGGCEGATIALGFEYVSASTGLMQEYQYSYSSYYGEDSTCTLPEDESTVATINGYVKLPTNNYTAVMNALATVGPVGISIDASIWHAYESGVYDGCDQDSPDIDHGVVLVGYGEEATGQKYWIVRNSWSPAWGEKGYIRLAREETDGSKCGVDTTPEDGNACAGDHDPVKVCGTCGVLFDVSYPLNAQVL